MKVSAKLCCVIKTIIIFEFKLQRSPHRYFSVDQFLSLHETKLISKVCHYLVL